jgi:hypothetical protein
LFPVGYFRRMTGIGRSVPQPATATNVRNRRIGDALDTPVLAINPAHAVRGPKHVVKRGKTPVLTQNAISGVIRSRNMRRAAIGSFSSSSIGGSRLSLESMVPVRAKPGFGKASRFR